AEGRQAAVLLGEVVNQLLDDHRLAHAGAAEQPDLAALGVGRQQVDDLDAGLEHLLRWRELFHRWSRLVDAAPLQVRRELFAEVDRFAGQVEDASEGRLARGTRYRRA